MTVVVRRTPGPRPGGPGLKRPEHRYSHRVDFCLTESQYDELQRAIAPSEPLSAAMRRVLIEVKMITAVEEN